MSMSMYLYLYLLLADITLLLHVAIVLFVIGGLLLVLWGNTWGKAGRWQWVNALWFRLLHLAAIGTVVAQSWLGITCPLTTLESWLRVQGGGVAYQSGFIEYWMGQLIFYNAPGWVFTVVYTLFASLVAAAWWVYPPKADSLSTGRRSAR